MRDFGLISLKESQLSALTTAGMAKVGAVYGQQGRLLEAAAAFERGLELEPASGAAHYHLASLYYAAGRRELATRHFRRAGDLGVAVPEALLAELAAVGPRR